MTEYERIAKVRRINTLMSACRLIPNRADVLSLWNAESYDEMTDAQIVALQAFMETAHRTKTTPAPAAIRQLRSQALSLMNRIGLYASPDDWTKVNRFLLQRRIGGRLLYMLDAPDLQALIRKLRAIGAKQPAGTAKHCVQVTPLCFIPSDGPAVVN